MSASTVQSIGDRITYAWHEDALTIIIDQAIPRSQRLMLEGWFLAWLGVGGATAMEMAGATGSDRTFFLVFMVFLSLAFVGTFLLRQGLFMHQEHRQT